jgi:hypothetical protein
MSLSRNWERRNVTPRSMEAATASSGTGRNSGAGAGWEVGDVVGVVVGDAEGVGKSVTRGRGACCAGAGESGGFWAKASAAASSAAAMKRVGRGRIGGAGFIKVVLYGFYRIRRRAWIEWKNWNCFLGDEAGLMRLMVSKEGDEERVDVWR